MRYMLKKMMREKKMGPLKFKKREISPNTVLLEEESMPVVVENPTFDLTPAVVFETDTIYTYDGPQAVSAAPEQAIYEINSEILENVYSLRGIDESNVEAVTNVVHSNLSLVADNYAITLKNIYDVYINTLNDIFYDDETDLQVLQFEPNYALLDRCSDIQDFVITFLYSSIERRKFILEQVIGHFAVSHVNDIGSAIYLHTKQQFNTFMAGVSGTEAVNSAPYLMDQINSCFARMMADMTYESGVFCSRFIEIADTIPPYEKIKDFTYLED